MCRSCVRYATAASISRSRRKARWSSSAGWRGRAGSSRSRLSRRSRFETKNGARKGRRFVIVARSRRLGLEVAKHDVARLVVHFGLEDELVFQRDRPGGGRPCRDLIEHPFHVGEFCKHIIAKHEWRETRPAPQRHIDDGVGIADHVTAVGEMVVENGVWPR